MNLKVERGCHIWVELVREMRLEFYERENFSNQQHCTRDKQPNPALTVLEQLNSASWNGMAEICSVCAEVAPPLKGLIPAQRWSWNC